MEHVFNPYLPLTEYVPDGEPHVFDGRLYIYGSHDRSGGTAYCEQDYVTWSAPVDDLSDWRYEGVIYRKNQDPSNADGNMQLWAPDVTKGPDGRYYLYYCFSFYPEIGVAVSDSPAGPFEFYGHVKYPENINGGRTLADFMPFDPAVLTDEDGRVYLYYGFAPGGEKPMQKPELTEEEMAAMTDEQRERLEKLSGIKFGEGAVCAELESDMLTLKEIPHEIVPGENKTAGTSFAGHGFFEASSIRRFGDTYYFVYSSHKSHELCYATSSRPDGDFVFGGTIVSNGDIGIKGRTEPTATIGNNHGGLVEVNGQYYIFYHRPTQGTEFSRQGCAEPVTIEKDGSIKQVEMTSCGLNGGPLPAEGCYPAGVACHITSPDTMDHIDFNDPRVKTQTRVTESGNVSYITDITGGTVLGYKYFSCENVSMILLEIRGEFDGSVRVSHTPRGRRANGEALFQLKKDHWTCELIPVEGMSGVRPVYLIFEGTGRLELRSFAFIRV